MTTLAATTELEAVNTMLQAIGADPINSITVSVDSDVANAVAVLAETSRQIQSQGWNFNLDTRYPMAKTVAGEYALPLNALSLDLSDDFPYLRATVRAGKLYDQDNRTTVWDRNDLTFDVIWYFPFEELPQTARHYITMKAARKFQARSLGSENLGKFTAQDESEAYNIFIDAEALDGQFNILNGNYSVARVLNRWPSYPAR